MSAGVVVGLLLAAGESRRMRGGNKLLREWGGEPLIRRIAKTALGSQLDSLLAVVGHESDAVQKALEGLEIEFVLNPKYAQGMGSSLSAGVERVRERADAVVILLGDMPRIQSSTIDTVLARWRQGGLCVVHCGSVDSPRPPTLFSRELFADLTALSGDQGARSIIESKRERSGIVTVEPAELSDFDESSDWPDAEAP
ncbi:MAG: nucleotidyltransferase family protein [Fimbriimonadaceae bacterium]|nr:Purine catabolism protein PucB [Fimbriimonadaceae bacterium]MCL4283857.1 nucleotidyltransferase family protein [Fimbriimonadaceae bacterium]QOJ12682.1 MAG: nucleotidyltransferase family protein [Chthonomonadaceae bacterium]